jgi:integrase
LDANGELDPESAPFGRATPDRVSAYARVLMATLAPRSAASAAIGLKCVLQRMHPQENWRWLKEVTNRLDVWSGSSTTRSPMILPAKLVFEGALADLGRLAASAPMSRRDQVHYRDTLIVALLTCCPIRLRNLTQMRIGKHLRQAGLECQLCFEAHETKTHQPIRYVLPSVLLPWLQFYLAEVRPGFPREPEDEGLWPGSKGRPLAGETLYSRVLRATERLFGVAIAPHSFRTMAATALADRSPEDALFARPLLGHRSPRTTERHYIRANQLLASVRINAILRNVRYDGRPKR